MNKRKWRILNSSIACLLVCATVFTVSVFAATSANTNVGSFIGFESQAVAATFSVEVDNKTGGNLVKSATIDSTSCLGTKYQMASFDSSDNQSSESKSLAITIGPQVTKTTSDLIIYQGDYFTISFEIEPISYSSEVLPYYYKVTYDTTNRGSTFSSIFSEPTYKIDVGDTAGTYASYSAYSSSTSTEDTVIITFMFTVKTNYCNAINLNVGSFNIEIAHNAIS